VQAGVSRGEEAHWHQRENQRVDECKQGYSDSSFANELNWNWPRRDNQKSLNIIKHVILTMESLNYRDAKQFSQSTEN
jgi:hypothetical protein